MKIKHFIMLGSFFLPLFLSGCQEGPSREKHIGLQLWSVREAMNTDPVTTIGELGKMGYKFVEAAGYRNGGFYGMGPVAFRQLVEDSGMQFISSHASHDLPDESNWDEVMAWWDECIDIHAEAGVQYIVQPSMGPEGYQSLDGLQRFCDYFNAVGEKCNEKGIRFGYHNHDGEFSELEGKVIYDYMLENTDPDKVMFQLDLYWAVYGGADPVFYLENHPGRFEHWHVKDEAELGAEGIVDFERIFQFAESTGVDCLIVEVERYNYDPMESVKISLDYLNQADFVRPSQPDL
ncbi:MAG: sugar phosphate isomerase/epimerase family protein [Bacteroidales bacterium]